MFYSIEKICRLNILIPIWSDQDQFFPSAGRLMNNGEDVEYTDDEMMAAISPIVSG